MSTEQQIALLNVRLATGLLTRTQHKFYIDILRFADKYSMNIL